MKVSQKLKALLGRLGNSQNYDPKTDLSKIVKQHKSRTEEQVGTLSPSSRILLLMEHDCVKIGDELLAEGDILSKELERLPAGHTDAQCGPLHDKLRAIGIELKICEELISTYRKMRALQVWNLSADLKEDEVLSIRENGLIVKTKRSGQKPGANDTGFVCRSVTLHFVTHRDHEETGSKKKEDGKGDKSGNTAGQPSWGAPSS